MTLHNAPVGGPIGIENVPDERHAALKAVRIELASAHDLAKRVHAGLELGGGGPRRAVGPAEHGLVGEHVRDGLVGVLPRGAAGGRVRRDLPHGALGRRHERHEVLHALLGGHRLPEAGRREGQRRRVADGAVRARDAVHDAAEVRLVREDVDERLPGRNALGEVVHLGHVGLAPPGLQLRVLRHGAVAGVVGVDERRHELPDCLGDDGGIFVEGEGLQLGTDAAVDEAVVLQQRTVVVALEIGRLAG